LSDLYEQRFESWIAMVVNGRELRFVIQEWPDVGTPKCDGLAAQTTLHLHSWI
jgi:hypothetical protein